MISAQVLDTQRNGLDGRDGPTVLASLREWGAELGFSQIGVADVDLSHAEAGLLAWLDNGFHGSMDYMAAHGLNNSAVTA